MRNLKLPDLSQKVKVQDAQMARLISRTLSQLWVKTSNTAQLQVLSQTSRLFSEISTTLFRAQKNWKPRNSTIWLKYREQTQKYQINLDMQSGEWQLGMWMKSSSSMPALLKPPLPKSNQISSSLWSAKNKCKSIDQALCLLEASTQLKGHFKKHRERS